MCYEILPGELIQEIIASHDQDVDTGNVVESEAPSVTHCVRNWKYLYVMSQVTAVIEANNTLNAVQDEQTIIIAKDLNYLQRILQSQIFVI